MANLSRGPPLARGLARLQRRLDELLGSPASASRRNTRRLRPSSERPRDSPPLPRWPPEKHALCREWLLFRPFASAPDPRLGLTFSLAESCRSPSCALLCASAARGSSGAPFRSENSNRLATARGLTGKRRGAASSRLTGLLRARSGALLRSRMRAAQKRLCLLALASRRVVRSAAASRALPASALCSALLAAAAGGSLADNLLL